MKSSFILNLRFVFVKDKKPEGIKRRNQAWLKSKRVENHVFCFSTFLVFTATSTQYESIVFDRGRAASDQI